LEEAVIQTVDQFGVEARRFSPHTGVWIQDRKVCAIGIQVKRWVSMHGIALNCNTDLTPFTWITPCGIKDYGVTSLSRELDRCVTPNEVAPVFVTAMEVLCQ
jgi:lipoyl(octanoyl) transferase